MKHQDRSPCGYLTLSDTGKEVTLAGWVDALRDHGEVLFIHLRDRSGIVQVVFTPEATPPAICARPGLLKSEFCILLTGRVVKRVEGTENPAIPTGDIEVVAKDLTILSRADTLPFQISEKSMVSGAGVRRDEAVAEDLRLEYRYLEHEAARAATLNDTYDAFSLTTQGSFRQVSDTAELEAFIDRIIAEHPSDVDDFRKGNAKVIGFLMGLAMKGSQGKANPKLLREILTKRLN